MIRKSFDYIVKLRVIGFKKRAPVPKISHTYPTMMKLGSHTLPKENAKTIWITWHTPWFLLTSAFLKKNQQILLYREIQTYIPFRFIISNSSNFSGVFQDCFNKNDHNFDDVSKNGYPRSSWKKLFWKKGYDIIISVHNVTSKILSRDSNYNVNVVIWPKFGNSSISVTEVIVT